MKARLFGTLLLCALSTALSLSEAAASSATFLQTDASTKGNWKGVYGQDGNVIAQHSAAVPSYASIDPRNVNLMLYDLWSTDPRAPLKMYYSYSATERVASWFHAVDTMDFLITASDSQSHRIALYFCDFDYSGRSVTVQVLDAASNAVYDSRQLTDYTGGVYLVYNYSGQVIFRVINNTPGQYTPTGSVTAFFWGGGGATPPPPPSDTTPPAVSIATPTGGTVLNSVNLTANASDDVGVAGVQYQLNGTNLGPEQTSAPYQYTWDTTKTANGPYTLTAIARDAAGNKTTSAGITVTVNNPLPPAPPSGNRVTFLTSDTTTLGNWKGIYGQDGNVIAQHSVVMPSYATIDSRNVNLMLYDLWSTDLRSLLKMYYSYSPTERVASWFHTVNSMDFLITASDGNTHRIALYFCDYDRQGRSVTVQAVDASTNAILDSRALTDYTAGIYLVYNYSGQIVFRVINNNPGQYNPTGSVSAFFWGGGTTAPPPPPQGDTTAPSVSIATPAAGAVSGTVTVTANASDNVGVASVQYQLDGSNLGLALTAAPYSYSWDTTLTANGNHTLTAIARDAAGNSTTAAGVVVTVSNIMPPPPPPPSSPNYVTFLGTDAKTLGDWKGVYGQDGSFIAESSYTAPPYSNLNAVNTNRLLVDIWSTDPRAPLKYQYSYSPTERVVSHWYNRYYEDFQVNTFDHQQHRIALYFCDWQPMAVPAAFSQKRSITVQAIDSDTGALLDTRQLTDYTEGIYLVYYYGGNVTFHIANNYEPLTTNPNATVSAFFFGGQGFPH